MSVPDPVFMINTVTWLILNVTRVRAGITTQNTFIHHMLSFFHCDPIPIAYLLFYMLSYWNAGVTAYIHISKALSKA